MRITHCDLCCLVDQNSIYDLRSRMSRVEWVALCFAQSQKGGALMLLPFCVRMAPLSLLQWALVCRYDQCLAIALLVCA